ncbi:MAG: dihydrolipoamide acetyltransferase family protein [Thermomicrobiales bacterium]
MAEFRMPSLGADMESGTLVEWLVQPGAQVNRGDLVAVVETQKGAIDVEIFESGTITEILVEEGEEVPVGTPLAIVNGAHTEVATSQVAAAEPAATPKAAPASSPHRRFGEQRLRISPAARRLALRENVNLRDIHGSGPDAAITLADVELAIKAIKAPVDQKRTDSSAAMSEAIAAAMARSKREIPHYYLGHEIDMNSVMTWLERENTSRSVADRLVYAALLLKAVALAVKQVPEMNGFWTGGNFQPSDNIHVGVAIALRGGGLVAPAIHDTDRSSVEGIMGSLRDLVGRARSGRLRSSEVSDATITVTNLGEQSIEQVFGVIYPPQVALVGFGALVDRPRVENGGIFVRPTVFASLSADHRASVGHRGAQFLAEIDRLLQEPEKL